MPLPLFYVQSAAARWTSFKSRTHPSAVTKSPSSPPPHVPSYSREHSAYISRAREKWAARSVAVEKAVPIVTGRVVGRGEVPPAAGSWQEARRTRWQDRHELWRLAWEEMLAVERNEKETVSRACGVPLDVREARKLRKELMLADEEPAFDVDGSDGIAVFGGGCVGECDERRKVTEAIFAVGARSCRAGNGGGVCGVKRVLESAPAVSEASLSGETDTYELVLARYSGRPDELYRRRTARKWAAWRRASAAREAREAQVVEDAERNMKRRRGDDFLGSQRAEGEKGFAPFLFDTGMNCFVYSSKIAGKKELREGMLRKYSKAEEEAGEDPLQPRQKAHEMAEKTELFHTKVMNRFM